VQHRPGHTAPLEIKERSRNRVVIKKKPLERNRGPQDTRLSSCLHPPALKSWEKKKNVKGTENSSYIEAKKKKKCSADLYNQRYEQSGLNPQALSKRNSPRHYAPSPPFLREKKRQEKFLQKSVQIAGLPQNETAPKKTPHPKSTASPRKRNLQQGEGSNKRHELLRKHTVGRSAREPRKTLFQPLDNRQPESKEKRTAGKTVPISPGENCSGKKSDLLGKKHVKIQRCGTGKTKKPS